MTINLLTLDTETTGIDNDARAIELSASLYQVGEVSGSIATVSTLISVAENPAQSVNGIDARLTHGWDAGVFLDAARHLGRHADYWVAFNAEFDRPFVNGLMDFSRPWICARTEIDWFPGWLDRPRSQIDLALKLGIGVIHAHRAGDDVRTLVAAFDRQVDRLTALIDDAIARVNTPMLQAIVTDPKPQDSQPFKSAGFWRNDQWEWVREFRGHDRARLATQWNFPVRCLNPQDRADREQSPMVTIAAKVSKDDRQEAKDLFFRWDADRRIWVKEIRQWDFQNELWAYPFAVEVVS